MKSKRTSTKAATETVANPSSARMEVQGSISHQQMIAEAAYFRAEQRGFAAGCDLDDWLAAETEVAGHLRDIPAPPEES